MPLSSRACITEDKTTVPVPDDESELAIRMHVSNPFLDMAPCPDFDKATPECAREAMRTLLDDAEAQLKILETTAQATWESCMVPRFSLTEPLEFAWGLISHLHSVMNNKAWRSVHDDVQPLIVDFFNGFNQSERLHQAMTTLQANAKKEGLNVCQQRVLASCLHQAEQAGVGLPAREREQIASLNRELAAAQTTFANHLLDATQAFHLELRSKQDCEGLPTSLLTAASAVARKEGYSESIPEKGPWLISLEAPLFIPFMQNSTHRELREKIFRAYSTRASHGKTDNTDLLENILSKRFEKAQVLQASSFADLVLKMRMAKSVSAVKALLSEMTEAARPHAEHEIDEIRTYAFEHGQHDPLKPWDIAYWSERLRKDRFGVDDEDLRPYLPFPKVLEGLFALATQLFGICIKPVEVPLSTWHSDVLCFQIEDQDNGLRGYFYLDPYSRPSTKRGGAWMNPAFTRKRLPTGEWSAATAYLVCNQARSDNDGPALMTLSDVSTLFHEFGHALQHLLSTVEEPQASGINNVEWDAVELPSQFMEYWCRQEKVLASLSCHIKTGKSLPESWISQIIASQTFLSGYSMMRQLQFATLDMELHACYTPDGDHSPDDIKKHIFSEYSVLPMLEEDRFLCGFSHIFAGGYAAGYYSYLWAKVLAADAFAVFEEAGFDQARTLSEHGCRFRDSILSTGGSEAPSVLFKRFRGRSSQPEALLRYENLFFPPSSFKNNPPEPKA